MLIANFLGYKHWSSCWVYIIHILTPLEKPFHLDIINLAKHNEEEEINKLDKNIVMMKSINKILMKAKLKHYKI
jgi:mitochondrial fission protein ELM1